MGYGSIEKGRVFLDMAAFTRLSQLLRICLRPTHARPSLPVHAYGNERLNAVDQRVSHTASEKRSIPL